MFLEAFVLFALVSFFRLRQAIGQESVKKNNGNNYGHKKQLLESNCFNTGFILDIHSTKLAHIHTHQKISQILSY